jgi:hypothetical protein
LRPCSSAASHPCRLPQVAPQIEVALAIYESARLAEPGTLAGRVPVVFGGTG